MERKSHPVGVDVVKDFRDSGGPSNRSKRDVANLMHVYKVVKDGGDVD